MDPANCPPQSHRYAATLRLRGCVLVLEPSKVQRDLDALSVLALLQGWMTFRSPFQLLYSMVL